MSSNPQDYKQVFLQYPDMYTYSILAVIIAYWYIYVPSRLLVMKACMGHHPTLHTLPNAQHSAGYLADAPAAWRSSLLCLY